MTDHKASIQIKFEIYGKKFKTDMWINYCGQDGIDQRIVDWFEECYDKTSHP